MPDNNSPSSLNSNPLDSRGGVGGDSHQKWWSRRRLSSVSTRASLIYKCRDGVTDWDQRKSLDKYQDEENLSDFRGRVSQQIATAAPVVCREPPPAGTSTYVTFNAEESRRRRRPQSSLRQKRLETDFRRVDSVESHDREYKYSWSRALRTRNSLRQTPNAKRPFRGAWAKLDQQRWDPRLDIGTDILHAIKGIYEDELRPTLAELRRRLADAKIPPNLYKDLPNQLQFLRDRLIFDASKQEVLLIQPPPGFRGFVDPKDPEDPFDKYVWQEFNTYLISLMQNMHPLRVVVPSSHGLTHYQFQGGRYGMAQKMLRDPQLTSQRLRRLSVGELCHLVQLSIAYGVMQYENNILQPRATCLRIAAAFSQSDIDFPGGQTTSSNTPLEALKDEEDLMRTLREALQPHPSGMLLSQLKFVFENRLSFRLSQSIFGCTRLSTLLQQPQFASLCRVMNDDVHRVFVQLTEFPPPNGMHMMKQQRSRRSSDMTMSEAKRDVGISQREYGHEPEACNISYEYWRNYRPHRYREFCRSSPAVTLADMPVAQSHFSTKSRSSSLFDPSSLPQKMQPGLSGYSCLEDLCRPTEVVNSTLMYLGDPVLRIFENDIPPFSNSG